MGEVSASLSGDGISLPAAAMVRANFQDPRQPLPASDAALAACKKTVNEKQDDRSDDTSDEAPTLSGLIPADCLAEVSGDESSDDSENGGENETRRLIAAGHYELRDHSGDEPNDDCP